MALRTVPDMFEVAFSFAGEQRHLVLPLAEALDERLPGLVFYDEWFEWFIAGSGGDTRLQDIYLKRSKMVVVCVSEQYGGKPWTRTEHDAIRALNMQLPWDSLRILPLRVGDGEVPGILFNTITLDARHSSVQSLCEQMIARLALIPGGAGPAATVFPRTPHLHHRSDCIDCCRGHGVDHVEYADDAARGGGPRGAADC